MAFFFNFMDVISWGLSVSLFIFPQDLLPNADMVFWMVPFSFLLLNGINDIGPISGFLNHHGTTVWEKLGKLSMYVFLLHMPIVFIWKDMVHMNSPHMGTLMIIVISIVFSGIVMYVRERIRERNIRSGFSDNIVK